MKIDYISSDGIHRSEKAALEKMHAAFNASQFSQKWHGFACFELIDRETRDREIDLVLLTHDRILLIELKDWRGSISSQGDQWYLNGDSRGRSPVKVTSGKARLLHSRIKKRLRPPARDVSVEYRVVLCGEADASGVPADEKPLVCSLQDFLKICSEGAYEKTFRSTQSRYSPLDDLNIFKLFFKGNDFLPTVFSFQNYRIAGDALFSHPGGLYNEYKAVKRDDPNYQGLLRRWDFSSMMGQADTLEERSRIALRENQVLGYIREHDEELEDCLPIPLWSPTRDDVTVDFCELYRLPPRQSRLSEFVNKYGAQLAPSDRLAMLKVLLFHFASLHDIGVAHRDIGDHSVWLEAPTKVSISSFVMAYFPEALTVGELRETLRASNVTLPEDVKGLGDGVVSDPFRRDVYLLGVVSHYLLFLRWPTKDPQLGLYLWEQAPDSIFKGQLDSWICRSLELVPSDRFANAREMLDALNLIQCHAGELLPVPLSEFRPFETEELPNVVYAMGETLRTGRCHVYMSSVGAQNVIVKLWYGVQPDQKGPERSHRLLNFFERCRRLKGQPCDVFAEVIDFGLSPAGAFVVQTWVPGKTLAEDLLRRSLDRRAALQVCRSLIRSTQHFHRLGYEHGDLSPKNIVTNDDTIKFIDAVDLFVDGEPHTPAYSPVDYEQTPLEQRDCFAIAKICKEILDHAHDKVDVSIRSAPVSEEIAACLTGKFEVYRLDRILDQVDLCLNEQKADTRPAVAVRLVRQQQAETLAADNGSFHIGVFLDPRREDTVTLSVLGVRCQIIISLPLPTLQPARVTSRRVEHSEFVWLSRKAATVLSGVKIEVRPGPVDSAPDLISRLLDLPEVSAYIRDLRFPPVVEREIAPPSEVPIGLTLPSSREIWKALIAAEEETLPEAEVTGTVERDSSADCLRVPYSMASGPLDFDPDDVIEVFQEIEGELRRVGELNTRETSLTTLVVEHPFKFPHKLGAMIKFRSQQDRASFVRRRSAVERIVNKESAIPDLLQYFDATTSPSPTDYGERPTDGELNKYDLVAGERLIFSLNEQQREAFRRLWTKGPVGLLQGPPGTGKTAFIASFVHYALSKGAQNILLASQSHEAVNNAAEKIVEICRQTETPLQLVRFGAEGMVSDMIQRYHSNSVIQAYRDLARAELKTRVVSLSANLGLPEMFVADWFDLELHLGTFLRQLERLRAKAANFPETSADHRRYIGRIKQSEEMFATVAREKFALPDVTDQRVAVEELEKRLMRTHSVRSPDAVARLRQVIAVAHEWIHRLGTDRANFEEFLAKSRTVVCGTCVGLGRSQLGIAKNEYDWVIVDEAARATPSELAVAIQSGRRVLLVGDHRQLPPLYKDEVIDHICRTSNWKSHEYLTRSDFQRAFESSYGASVGAMLKTQYRMSPEIGELVSECFYPEKLEAGRGGPPAWFSSAPERLRAIVTWIDTSANGTEAHDRQLRGSTSFENPFEAREILDLLKAIAGQDEFLQHLITNTGTDERPIGVICMYADQKRLIQKQFDEQDWSSQLRRLVKIDTVDSYQGKQNRIIILSATRNNNAYSQGHLASPERVNVSISRAMDRLIIVGATRMWRSPNEDRPLGKVLRFIEARRDPDRFAVVGANTGSGVRP